jgi:hypothetical protein
LVFIQQLKTLGTSPGLIKSILLKEGLPREASVIYDSIYLKAMAEDNDIMLVRSVIGQCESLLSLEEEPLVKVIDRLNADAEKKKLRLSRCFIALLPKVIGNIICKTAGVSIIVQQQNNRLERYNNLGFNENF